MEALLFQVWQPFQAKRVKFAQVLLLTQLAVFKS
jgi:hypothetical protein